MRKILFLAFQFLILHVSATTYYVSTNGKPEGDGSKENPYNITTLSRVRRLFVRERTGKSCGQVFRSL